MTAGSIGFVGTGEIAQAIVRGIVSSERAIALSRRSERISGRLEREFEQVSVFETQEVLDRSETVFLCLRPEAAGEMLPALRFRQDHRVVSVMARLSCAQLAELAAPATDIVRMLPLSSVAEGRCPLPVYPDRPWVTDTMGPEHSLVRLAREDDLSACFASSTLVSAVAEMLDHGADWLAARLGDRGAAERYLDELVRGMLQHHADERDRFASLRDSLATPGTLNEEMIAALRRSDLRATLEATLDRLSGGD